MVEVRIRHVDYGKGATLGYVDLLKVDDIIPTLKEWGIDDYDNEGLAGQFTYDPDERVAYFEVLVDHE